MNTKVLKTKIAGSGLFAIDVVGESYYQDNLRQIVKSQSASIHYSEKTFRLNSTFQIDARVVSEPNNAHDPNAIQVLINNLKVGYLDRNTASRLTDQINRKGFDQIDSACISLVGGVCDEGGNFIYGVKLDIDTQSQRQDFNKNSNESEFTFLVANPILPDNTSLLPTAGLSVKFWQHPKQPSHIRIYCEDHRGAATTGAASAWLGMVPVDFIIPIGRHLNANLQFETNIEAKVDNTWQIKCRLVPESEIAAIREKLLQERRERLEPSLAKPYRPVKPITFRFETKKDNLKKGDLIEVMELPSIELILNDDGPLPISFRCLRTNKLFETTCAQEIIQGSYGNPGRFCFGVGFRGIVAH